MAGVPSSWGGNCESAYAPSSDAERSAELASSPGMYVM